MSAPTETPSMGWAKPGAARKAHFFDEGRSMCGGWMYLGPTSARRPPKAECCKACQRSLS